MKYRDKARKKSLKDLFPPTPTRRTEGGCGNLVEKGGAKAAGRDCQNEYPSIPSGKKQTSLLEKNVERKASSQKIRRETTGEDATTDE